MSEPKDDIIDIIDRQIAATLTTLAVRLRNSSDAWDGSLDGVARIVSDLGRDVMLEAHQSARPQEATEDCER